MDKLVIEGGVPLNGEVQISGAKNCALPLMAATLLANGMHTIGNVPHLRDIRTMQYLLANMGVSSRHHHALEVDSSDVHSFEAPYDLVKTMRASVLVLGPLLARYRQARISLPGGCAIGARPINLHLKALAQMGVDIDLEHGYVMGRAKRLHGASITFDQVTVTGTENIMMAASLADGVTVLKNSAREPEVVALAEYLNRMGARVDGAGTDEITVLGVNELTPSSCEVIPDRIEAGTYLVAAGITGGSLKLKGCRPDHLQAVMEKLSDAGLSIRIDGDVIEASRKGKIRSVNVETYPFPGFPTDMQAQFMALMTLGNGVSIIKERIFENRFMHVLELERMGADIELDSRTAVVRGVKKLSGAPVMATDLRASASLVLGALAAEGTSEIGRIYHLDRGYEAIEKKLSAVGATIERVGQ
jgi:UDP-N-acetylglucosamine 1-carboxyvinyltransferase